MWRRCWKSTHKKCLIPCGPWVNSTSCSLVRPKSISAGYSCKSVRSIFILQDPRPRNCLFVQFSCHSWLLMIPSWLEHMSLWQPLMNVWVLSHISLWITKWDLTWQRSWKFTFLSLQPPPLHVPDVLRHYRATFVRLIRGVTSGVWASSSVCWAVPVHVELHLSNWLLTSCECSVSGGVRPREFSFSSCSFRIKTLIPWCLS